MTRAADLRALGADFLRMLSQAGEQVELASEVLLENRIEHVGRVRALDRRVDALELALEDRCLELFAASAELGERDLRLVSVIYKSLTDVERIGDHAVHVAEDARVLAVEPLVKRYVELRRIIASVRLMLSLTARAFTERDADVAARAARLDLDVDDRHEHFYRELVTFLHEHPDAVPEALALTRIGRSLQRVGDHVENISERILHWLEAERAT
ncbi:phosphate signaling complex protein PhoU [Deinococcus pimensis]|uniref:phosphate signaling complex protein PhoU n=1 Tax=Deinococcus pimensis TaxID=309888 RepID=UPI0004BC73A5|nr:phosphate signaling complex protein PhoU [Deinococcus pimensis]